MPAVLVSKHGVLTWSTTSVHHSVEVAVTLEEIEKWHHSLLDSIVSSNPINLPSPLKSKHFQT